MIPLLSCRYESLVWTHNIYACMQTAQFQAHIRILHQESQTGRIAAIEHLHFICACGISERFVPHFVFKAGSFELVKLLNWNQWLMSLTYCKSELLCLHFPMTATEINRKGVSLWCGYSTYSPFKCHFGALLWPRHTYGTFEEIFFIKRTEHLVLC